MTDRRTRDTASRRWAQYHPGFGWVGPWRLTRMGWVRPFKAHHAPNGAAIVATQAARK